MHRDLGGTTGKPQKGAPALDNCKSEGSERNCVGEDMWDYMCTMEPRTFEGL